MPQVSPSLLQDAKDDSDSTFAVLMAFVVSFLTVTPKPAMAKWKVGTWSSWQDLGPWGNTCGHCARRALGELQVSPEGCRQ